MLRLERIWILSKTDFVQRYYQTKLGLLWAVLNPIFQLAVFYVCFTYLVFRSGSTEFVMYLFLGILTWQLFAQGSKAGLSTLFQKRYLIESTNINTLDLFIASIITVNIQFILTLGIFLVFTLFFDIEFSYRVLYFFPTYLSIILFSMGTGMILSVLKIGFRDINQVWDLVILAGFWSVPIIWEQALVYEEYTFLLYVNPITGMLINFRNALIYNELPDFNALIYYSIVSIITLIIGLVVVKKFSRKLTEIL